MSSTADNRQQKQESVSLKKEIIQTENQRGKLLNKNEQRIRDLQDNCKSTNIQVQCESQKERVERKGQENI